MVGFLVMLASSVTSHCAEKPLPSTEDPKKIVDWKGQVMGNTENGMRDLRSLHTFVNIFKGKHQGQYPDGISPMSTLIRDMFKDSKEYGINGIDDLGLLLRNSDLIFSNSDYDRKNWRSIIPYTLRNIRWDGSLVGSVKQKRFRDAVAWTDM